jgi:VIT family
VPRTESQARFRSRRRFPGSVIVTVLALLVFGYAKGRFTTARPFRSAWQTAVVGGLAATTAFVIALAIGCVRASQAYSCAFLRLFPGEVRNLLQQLHLQVHAATIGKQALIIRFIAHARFGFPP